MSLKHILSILTLVQVILANDYWDRSQKLLGKLPSQKQPELTLVSQWDPYIDLVESGIAFDLPMDHDKANQRRNYESFWSDHCVEVQQEFYNLITLASDEQNHIDATYVIYRMHLYGAYGFPHNKTLAFLYLEKFNKLTNYSNSSALLDLSTMYSTGLFGTIPIDNKKALIYLTMAADLGDLKAKQSLAYRYFAGIHVPRDYSKALLLYSEIAKEIRGTYTYTDWNIVPPHLEKYNIRLPDFHGGLLGDGLTTSSLTTTRKKSRRPDITSLFLTNMNSGGRIILQFGSSTHNQLINDNSDDAEDVLIDTYYTAMDSYEGTYTQLRNYTLSFERLLKVVDKYDHELARMDKLQLFFYGKCLELLGHMYFRGDGLLKPDIDKAELYLEKAITILEQLPNIRSAANVDLGLINQYVHNNITKAKKYYSKVVNTDINDGTADFQLSKLVSSNGQRKNNPFILVQISAARGHTPAIYEYAHMLEIGVDDMFSCKETAQAYKTFVEDNEHIMAPYLRDAFLDLLVNKPDISLWNYAKAAEQGYESAQVSAAYLLYQPQKQLQISPEIPESHIDMALTYYIRAFKQGNPDAGVVAGDIYYKIGDYDRSVDMYQAASLKSSVQAVWNLGHAYEYGLGIEQDFHLAKRFYEQVSEYNNKLYLAIRLTIWKLRLKSWLNWIKGKKVNYWESTDNTDRFSNQKFSGITFFEKVKRMFRKVGKENSENQLATESTIQDYEEGILNTLQAWGIHFEDIISILVIIFFMLIMVLIRYLVVWRRWNLRINGVEINPVEQQDQQQPMMDIQFFAI